MDQATFTGLFDAARGQLSDIRDLTAKPGQANLPIVVLVHGIGGNAKHWSDPISLDINSTWLFDTTVAPPNKGGAFDGLVSSPPYPKGYGTTWTQAVEARGFSYFNFSQSDSNGPIATAVAELVKILTTIESTIYGGYGSETPPPLVIIAHSRGGLVSRLALKQLGSTGLPHLTKVMTLSTPHTGSYMPKLAQDYNTMISTQVDFSSLGNTLPGPLYGLMRGTINKALSGVGEWVRTALSHTFGSMAAGGGFPELIPDSPMFQQLTAGEQPLPGVRYYSFGGTYPTFINLYIGIANQHFLLMPTASGKLIELIDHSIPPLRHDLDGLAELVAGDSSVAAARSLWPAAFNAPHTGLSYNHMQALVHQPLQTTVLDAVAQP